MKDPETVKHALENYSFFTKRKKAIEREIEAVTAQMYKAGGSVAKRPENATPRSTILIGQIEKRDKLYQEHNINDYFIKIADQAIQEIDPEIREIFIDKYKREKPAKFMQEKYGYTNRHILNIINKAISELCEEREK